MSRAQSCTWMGAWPKFKPCKWRYLAVSETTKWAETMIEFFLWGGLIFGQSLYWSFLKRQTEVVSDEYWKALSLRFRMTRVASHRISLSSQMNKSDTQEGLNGDLHNDGSLGALGISDHCREWR